MQVDDLSSIFQMGIALWPDTDFSCYSVVNTVSAVSLLSLNSERALDRSVVALLKTALDKPKKSFEQRAGSKNFSFYHLSIEERAVLSALCLADWSYQRIVHVFQEVFKGYTQERVQEVAWKARTKLGFFPVLTHLKGAHCPDYDVDKPWCQRFLDDELISTSERLYLQNHMMVCLSCRKILSSCRDLYFKIEKEMNSLIKVKPGLLESFQKALYQRPRDYPSFYTSLKTFFKRKNILFVLFIWVLVSLYFRLYCNHAGGGS